MKLFIFKIMNLFIILTTPISFTVFMASRAMAGTEIYESYTNSVGGCFKRECGLPFLKSASTGISLSFDGAKYIFKFEFPAGEVERKYLLTKIDSNYDQDSIIEAINESVSPNLHLFAKGINKRESNSDGSKSKFFVDIEITARLITDSQRKAGTSLRYINIKVPPEVVMGRSNFRGTPQELNIKNLVVPYDSITSNALSGLKDEAARWEEIMGEKPDKNSNVGGKLMQFYFQNGTLKREGYWMASHIPPLDETSEFCSVAAYVKYFKEENGIIINSIKTLTYGPAYVGSIPVGHDGRRYERSQSFQGTYNNLTEKWVPYNKAGSGQNDGGNVESIECFKNSLEPIKVSDLEKALGRDNFTITYPVGNFLEVYLDNHYGLQKYLKGLSSPSLE